MAPLSAKDTLELQDAYREALALVEAASLGLGSQGSGRSSALAVAAALNGRQDRALKWAQGVLAKAIEAREAGIRFVCWPGTFCCAAVTLWGGEKLVVPSLLAGLPCGFREACP